MLVVNVEYSLPAQIRIEYKDAHAASSPPVTGKMLSLEELFLTHPSTWNSKGFYVGVNVFFVKSFNCSFDNFGFHSGEIFADCVVRRN